MSYLSRLTSFASGLRPVALAALVVTAASAAQASLQTPTQAPPARPTQPAAPARQAPAAKPQTPPAKPTTPADGSGTGTQPEKPADKPTEKPTEKPAEKPAEKPSSTPATEKSDKAGAPLEYVKMQTSMGTIILELNREKAPLSVENFLNYVDKKFYDSTVFDRVIPTFMIQGGGFTADLTQKPTDAPIKNEWQNGLKNVRGSLAMARTPEPDSATSQFFINTVDNNGGMNNLDKPDRGGSAYAVFGRVYAGMEVVDQIKDVPTGGVKAPTGQPMNSVPKSPVLIVSVTRITEEEAKKFVK
jgi:cyclophilin family peptidyl-prolyl cis-trans isomerase